MKLKRIFACGVSTLSLVAVGCSEEKTYCDGLNESNMPGAIVLVERMDSAIRYELAADDERVFLPDDHENLISCRDIDGLGRVSFPATIEISESTIYRSRPSELKRQATCDEIQFSGSIEEVGLYFFDDSDLPISTVAYSATRVRPDSFSAGVEPDCRDDEDTCWLTSEDGVRSAFVVSALSIETRTYWNTERLRADELIYYQDSDDGAPPLVIGRAYSFRRGDVPDGLAEYLGVPELQNEGFQCVDLFFGYYEEGE